MCLYVIFQWDTFLQIFADFLFARRCLKERYKDVSENSIGGNNKKYNGIQRTIIIILYQNYFSAFHLFNMIPLKLCDTRSRLIDTNNYKYRWTTYEKGN